MTGPMPTGLMPTGLMPNGLVLTGLPGSGASSVARVLGARHGLPVHDTDREVETRLGAAASDIFVRQGEQAFREAERVVALELLARTVGDRAGEGREPAVVVVGGGAVAQQAVAEALRAAAATGVPVVFLDVAQPDAARRLGLLGAAPAGLGSPRALWQRLADQRRAACRAVASVVVATDGIGVDEVADRVEESSGTEADR